MLNHLSSGLLFALCFTMSVSAFSSERFVRTPDGLYPSACVQDVGNHATVDTSGAVKYANGLRGKLTPCLGGKPPAIPNPPDYTPPSSWVMDSIWASPRPAVHMTSTFVVPSEPTVSEDQTVFLFPGIRPADGSSVLQPVLQWGNGHARWLAASWSCAAISGGLCPHSSYIEISPGDTIFGEITGTNCTSSGQCDWAITTTDKTNGQTTTLNTTRDRRSYVLLFGGVLESYGVRQCADYPSNGSATFTNVTFYDQSGNVLAPDWYPQYDVTDYCKLSIQAKGPTTELDFTDTH